MANILLGVSSSISLYKSLEIISILKKQNHNVQVILSSHAKNFISPNSFSFLSNQKCIVDTEKIDYLIEKTDPSGKVIIPHIALARKADLFILAPATANLISKMAYGIADNLIVTTYLAFKGPVLVAPAMNSDMWHHETTQRNIALLKKNNIKIIDPIEGILACGEEGIGKLADIKTIIGTIEKELAVNSLNKNTEKAPLKPLKALISLGGTREPLDRVRYLSNYSSGRMGVSLIEELYQKGAEITALCGHIDIELPSFLTKKKFFSSNEDLQKHLKESLEQEHFDFMIMAAAPSDFEIKNKQLLSKIKKQPSLSLELIAKPDILKSLKKPEKTIFVGFAAESDNLKKNTLKKLKEKNLDIIVGNIVSSTENSEVGIGKDLTSLYLLDKNNFIEEHKDPITKQEAGKRIIDYLLSYKKRTEN